MRGNEGLARSIRRVPSAPRFPIPMRGNEAGDRRSPARRLRARPAARSTRLQPAPSDRRAHGLPAAGTRRSPSWPVAVCGQARRSRRAAAADVPARRSCSGRYRPAAHTPFCERRHASRPAGSDRCSGTSTAPPAAASRACQPAPACGIVPVVATLDFLILIVARFSS